MQVAERKTRELLEQYGATFVRFSSNGHQVWQLPTGKTWTCAQKGRDGDPHGWMNALHRLQRDLEGVEPISEQTFDPKAESCPGCHHLAMLTELGLCQNCTENGIPNLPKRGVIVLDASKDKPEPEPEPMEGNMVVKKKGSEWTAAEVARLKKLTEDGWKASKIAEALGRTLIAVNGKRKSEGIKARRTSWTEAEDAKLRKLTAEGKTLDQISKIMKRKPGSIKARKTVIGVYSKGPYRNSPQRVAPPAPVKSRPSLPGSMPKLNGTCQLTLEFPNGQRVSSGVGQELAQELALRILLYEV